MIGRLETLQAGLQIPFGGDRTVTVSEQLAAAFSPGDRLIVVQDTGDLLHIPRSVAILVEKSIDDAFSAFGQMGSVDEIAVTTFYRAFAANLADDDTFAPIASANRADLVIARQKGRSTTRLELTPRMRGDMISGLEIWAETIISNEPTEAIEHDGWRVEQHRDGLGVVGFVFEGRPNVFADATGVLRTGNTVVFRIGSDALGTARAIVEHALAPAIASSGLPTGAVTLVDSPERSAGWSLFSDPRIALAVARGSGQAVAQLGAVARQTGTPVSLHGTGGAWLVVAADADTEAVRAVVENSLDRKVCNTLNTVAIVRSGAHRTLPAVLSGVAAAAGRRETNPKLHVVGDVSLPAEWYATVPIRRAEGDVPEPRSEPLGATGLGTEWEWEDSPEVTLVLVDSIAEAVELFNRHSPRFTASLMSPQQADHDRFYATVDAPFVGDGFTRWVDGQYALNRPELGLSNWQFGRLFGRAGVLSGDSIYTVRTRAFMDRSDIAR